MMYYGQIKLVDTANGTGMRLSIFVSGCTNHCKGCFQPKTWDFQYGQLYTQKTEDFIINELKKPYYEGLTLLGGEPFEPCNQQVLVKLVKRVKQEIPDKTIWAYTGFLYDKDLQEGGSKYISVTDELLSHIDILVDGKFMENRKNIRLRFRGSENQRIIDLNQSRAANKIVLSEFHDN